MLTITNENNTSIFRTRKMLTWKNDSLISARAKGKKNKYRLIYQVREKVANATLEVYQDGCNMVKVFGKDFDWLKAVANEMESWQ